MQEAEKKITLKKEDSWVRQTYLKEKRFVVSLGSSIHLIFLVVFFFVCWLFFKQDKNGFEEIVCLYLN